MKRDDTEPSKGRSNRRHGDTNDSVLNTTVKVAASVDGEEGCSPVLGREEKEEAQVLLHVKVMGCRNLKSPLKRVVSRPINAVVDVCVRGEIQSTQIVPNSPHPVFADQNTFLFGVPLDAVYEGFVELTVSHKGLVSYDVIGVARIPFAALRTLPGSDRMELRTDQATHVILPLLYKEANVAAIGKGFYERKVDCGSKDCTESIGGGAVAADGNIREGNGQQDSNRQSACSTDAMEDIALWYNEVDFRKYMGAIASATFDDEPGKKKTKPIPTLYVQISKHLVE